jgi:hypothetical protein
VDVAAAGLALEAQPNIAGDIEQGIVADNFDRRLIHSWDYYHTKNVVE